MGTRDQTKSFWERCAPSIQGMYLSYLGDEIDRLERPEILSYLPSFKDKAVLDLGAGIGRYTGEFAQTAARVVSVDLSTPLMDENRLRNSAHSQIEYICSDAMALSFPDRSFDLIFLNSLLMYLEDDEVTLLLRRISKWLKPRGFLFFRESCAPVRLQSTNSSYFAIYRNLIEYPRFFGKGWSLHREGNIMAIEVVQADPFKCFWLYQNTVFN